jgi:hypothetical protein
MLFSFILFFLLLSQSYAVDVNLEWEANTQPDLDHYVVYWGTESGSYNDNSKKYGHYIGADEITYTVTSLVEGTTYYFAIKAFDNRGRPSEYSNEVSTDNLKTDPSALKISKFGVPGSEDSKKVSPDKSIPKMPPADSLGSGSRCFIATAVYGSPMSSNVKILCQFRDEYLKPHTLGKKLFALYERYSPYLADQISKNGYLKAAVRCALWPVLGVAYVSMHTSLGQKIIILIIMIIVSSWVVIFWRRRKSNYVSNKSVPIN